MLGPYFPNYVNAIEQLTEKLERAANSVSASGRVGYFREKLERCPTGQKHFSQYESIGIEMWQYVFPTALGSPNTQQSTFDRVHRRDVLFRNHRESRFWQRVADRYAADTIIVDFKNDGKPVPGTTMKEVESYANKALGRLIFVVSRRGAAKSFKPAQVSTYNARDTVVLVISDNQMLEMVSRKEKGEQPEDLLEDILEDFLYSV